MLVVDVSNYQGRLSADTVACWQSQGVGHVFVRASLESADKIQIARQQLQACRDAGIGVSIYAWSYPSVDSPEGVVEETLAAYDDLNPAVVALDVEETQYVGTPAENIAWLHRCLAALDAAGKRVCIYSAKWYWDDPRYMAGTTEFSHLPLWVAQYDGIPDLSVWTRFAGGQAPSIVGKQWTDQLSLCGYTVDGNEFSREWLESQPEGGLGVPTMQFDPDTSPERQTSAYACSIRTATWMLRSVGIETTAAELHDLMVPSLVTPELGLLDGSGAQLAAWLTEHFGLDAHHKAWVSWDYLQQLAGSQPYGIGGAAWYHWVAVRGVATDGGLRLANPAPGYQGVWDHLSRAQWDALGPFACIWINVPTAGENGDDMAEVEALHAEVDRLNDALAAAHSWGGATVEDILKPAHAELTAALTGAFNAKKRRQVEAVRSRLGEWAGVEA